MSTIKEFTKGLWKENPIFVLVLGMCPTLATTSNATNGFGMGMATLTVLVGSNFAVSLLKNQIPKKVRIPCYITIIATFVTAVQILMEAYSPSLNKALGIFIPLIVANCLILGRSEAFASQHSVVDSVADAIGMGLGFTFALTSLGAIREFLRAGSLFDVKIITGWTHQFQLMNFAPGAFIVIGFMLAGFNYINKRKAHKNVMKYEALTLGGQCSGCGLCFDKKK